MTKFSILISTKNRLEDLKITLQKISHLLGREDVECIVYDDASVDNTSEFLKESYPNLQLITNKKSLGYIYNRNYLLNTCKGKYAISLDDDAYFLTENCLEIIENHFETNENCGVIACRIFWGKEEPLSFNSDEVVQRVNGFVGCGHIWNLASWNKIPSYPEWFEFYGEENFASFQIFKAGLEITYHPEIFIQHRVDVKSRKKGKDYQSRTRKSLRSGWYLYFLFYPLKIIPKRMAFTLFIQIKNKTLKGDFKATLAIFQALFDVVVNVPNFIKNSNRLTIQEFKEFTNLPPSKIYWKPENE